MLMVVLKMKRISKIKMMKIAMMMNVAMRMIVLRKMILAVVEMMIMKANRLPGSKKDLKKT